MMCSEAVKQDNKQGRPIWASVRELCLAQLIHHNPTS